ncbi:serine protease inhibitor dipetalogastin-like [Dendronephthya gigantea]|uniref:serine protease inhibitor dipetalogastin-like n=1 Tax=Dendronephthya gigantea TaxID=151771 RepID=UPI00106ABAE6|nr:serine protease inhibitor dipetalogastin-like [Dendronephthya gigantea]
MKTELKCSAACPRNFVPQCGTDGKTYANSCTLKHAQCESDGEIRLAHHGECEPKPEPTCAVACPTKRLSQVCGSDANTYPNYCILKETACQFGEDLKVVHRGPCEPKCNPKIPLPWSPECGTDGITYGNKYELKNALCKSDGEVRLAHHGACEIKPKTCAVPCVRKALFPVCGSDRNTYPNHCILEETACQFEENITVLHKEPCEPRCSAACYKNFDPQCGPDGKTYANSCTLKYAQCESDGEIRLAHHGECEPKCPERCTVEYDPQCGTDGKTYGNPCFLKVASCESDGEVKLAHHGECELKQEETQVTCAVPCPRRRLRPVCGSDANTYTNVCILKQTACQFREDLKVVHRGPCETKPEPTCIVPCPKIQLPAVCGSDGNTYPNYCILEETACEFGENITIVHKGPCIPKCRAGCPKLYDPQCGTDGKTYSNPCMLRYAQCGSDGEIRLAYHGECKVPLKE